jgi:hypothetical protein
MQPVFQAASPLSIRRVVPLRFLYCLVQPPEKKGPGGFDYFRFSARFDLDIIFLDPIPEIRHVRTVAESRAEAAAPANEFLRVQIRWIRRSIE